MEAEEIASHQFTDEHYIALGKMVIAFQSLEQSITNGLAFLMHPNEIDQALGFTYTVLNEMSFGSRVKLLSNYVETHPITHFVPSGVQYEKVKAEEFPEVLEKLRTGIRIAGVAEEKRNQLIHSYWLTDVASGPPGSVLRMKLRAKYNKTQGSTEYVTAETISAIVEEMNRASGMIFEATQHLRIFLRSAT